jgi:hypothetical protein
MTDTAASEAEFVVHMALALFGLELAIGTEDVCDAVGLVSWLRRRGRRRLGGRGVLLLVFVFRMLLVVALNVPRLCVAQRVGLRLSEQLSDDLGVLLEVLGRLSRLISDWRSQ